MNPLKASISYSHRDENLLERLYAHLAMLRRKGHISEWYDREIRAGSTIDHEIFNKLDSCALFLALVSPDLLNSSYCYDTEMERAIQRHKAGALVIVPIILEPVLNDPLLAHDFPSEISIFALKPSDLE